MAWMGDALQI
jgi:hypothetical protein